MKIKPEFYIVTGHPVRDFVAKDLETTIYYANQNETLHLSAKVEIIPVARVSTVTYFDSDSISIEEISF